MFRAIKFLVALPVIAAAAFVVFYFLPSHTKEWTFTKLTGLIPATLEEKAREFAMTPPEKRARLLGDLEEKLDALKAESATSAAPLFDETESIIADLKAKSAEQSFTEIAKAALAKKLVGSVFGTTTQCAAQ